MTRALFMALVLTSTAAADTVAVDSGAIDHSAAQVSVQVDAKGDTTLDVHSGAVKVRADGKETHVGAGESVHAAKGKALRHWLAPPSLVAPADGSLHKSAAVPLSWRAVPGASAYAVEVAAAPDFAAPVEAERSDGSSVSLKLPAGTWYWRVLAVAADGSRGRPSPTRQLTVDVTPPKLKAGKPQWR